MYVKRHRVINNSIDRLADESENITKIKKNKLVNQFRLKKNIHGKNTITQKAASALNQAPRVL